MISEVKNWKFNMVNKGISSRLNSWEYLVLAECRLYTEKPTIQVPYLVLGCCFKSSSQTFLSTFSGSLIISLLDTPLNLNISINNLIYKLHHHCVWSFFRNCSTSCNIFFCLSTLLSNSSSQFRTKIGTSFWKLSGGLKREQLKHS